MSNEQKYRRRMSKNRWLTIQTQLTTQSVDHTDKAYCESFLGKTSHEHHLVFCSVTVQNTDLHSAIFSNTSFN